MKNVMYFSYQEYFLFAAREMIKENWTPVFWCTNSLIEDEIKKNFPEILCHDHYDMAKGILPVDYVNKIYDKNEFDRVFNLIEPYIENVLIMLDRNDSFTNSFSTDQKMDHLKKMTNYWLNIIKDLDPDFVIFEQEPHQASEYILYAILQVINIKTITFINTKFLKTMYPVKRFEDGSLIIKNKYQNSIKNNEYKKISLQSDIEKYLSLIRGDYIDAMDFHLGTQKKEIRRLLSNKSNLFFKILYFDFINSLFKKFSYKEMKVRLFYLLPVLRKKSRFFSDQKQFNRSLDNSYLSYYEYLFYVSLTILKKKSLKKYYQKLSFKKELFNEKYIYFSLQYQPERTSCPLGNSYANQLKILKLLCDHLPSNYKIYVKEHPSQFFNHFARYGETTRSKKFYDKISNSKNTIIVPLDTDNFQLIDQAEATVTITSTSGWESVVRGKPCIIFGYSWYRYCEGVFYVNNKNELKHAIGKIINGYRIDKKKVNLFAKIIKENSFGAYTGNRVRLDNLDREEDVGKVYAEAMKSIVN